MIKYDEIFTLDKVKEMLLERFKSFNVELAKKDVSNFIRTAYNLNMWKNELFISTIDNLECKE